jgi:hypothetical protein
MRTSLVAALAVAAIAVAAVLGRFATASTAAPASGRTPSPGASATAAQPATGSPGTAVPQTPRQGITVTAVPAPDAAGGEEVARAFAVAYETVQPGDTPQAIRARVRPYDTDRFDAGFGQGGGAGLASPAVASVSVEQVQDLGLAPDDHLVELVVLARQGGRGAGTVYLELYLAHDHGRWLVDEVAA